MIRNMSSCRFCRLLEERIQHWKENELWPTIYWTTTTEGVDLGRHILRQRGFPQFLFLDTEEWKNVQQQMNENKTVDVSTLHKIKTVDSYNVFVSLMNLALRWIRMPMEQKLVEDWTDDKWNEAYRNEVLNVEKKVEKQVATVEVWREHCIPILSNPRWQKVRQQLILACHKELAETLTNNETRVWIDGLLLIIISYLFQNVASSVVSLNC